MGIKVLRLLMLVMFAAVLMLLGGCGDDTTVIQSASASGIVSGRVVDRSTMQPVKNAEVVLIVNGVKTTTRSSSSGDPDVAGTFVFSGVTATGNYGASHILRVTAAGFATAEMYVNVVGSINNAPVTTSLGIIPLGKSFDLTVITTDAGTPVSGVTITATSNWGNAPNVTAVTDANGVGILKGLNQEVTYHISNAPFYDGNGMLKYVSSIAGSAGYLGGQIVSLPLVKATRQDDIEIVASNLLPDGTSYSSDLLNRRVITPDGVVKIVFNYPVALSGEVTATYVNNLVASSDPDYGKVISVPTISASLDPTGTILTITNAAPYLKNQTYTFNGTVSAEVNSQTQFFSLGSVSWNPYFASSVYVSDTTATGLSSLTELKADNFNGTSGITGTLDSEQVYVEFPEKVYGSYTVVAKTVGGAVAVVNDAPVSFDFTDGAMVYAGNVGGGDNVVVFRLPINSLYLADNSSSSVNDVTISFSVTDAEGNNFSKTVTLPVQ